MTYALLLLTGIVKTEAYHPHLIIDILLSTAATARYCEYCYFEFPSWDYTLLYNILSSHDWSCVCNSTSVDDAVASLNSVVQDAMEQAIPRGVTKKSKFPHWFSSSLRYYISKKNYYYRRFKKKKSDCLYNKFSFYLKLVKTTIKLDRFRWLQSIDDNLKTQPKQFCKCVATHRKRNSTYIQLEVDGILLVEPNEVADAFAKHFLSVYNIPCPGVSPPLPDLPNSCLWPPFPSWKFVKPLNV
jgi:hypothetical protein